MLKAKKIHVLEDSGDLMHPGDLCIRQLPQYNSTKIIRAVVMKCPFCNMDMASTGTHTITTPSKMRKLLSVIGFPAGVTVTPMLMCPYGAKHVFYITNGRIKKAI